LIIKSGVKLKFYKSILGPLLHRLDPERAHQLSILCLKLGIYPRRFRLPDPVLQSRLWGLNFPLPIGVAAGFDKNAEVFNELLNLGFGFVETGTVTPLAQFGNDKPRMYRLREDQGIINRLGFNNLGLDSYSGQIKKWSDQKGSGIVGANIGNNKNTVDPISDFVSGISMLSNYASYLTINISSPNTPGLRNLQSRSSLKSLIKMAKLTRDKCKKKPPLLVKIAPDLSESEINDVAEIALETEIDGLIISNTTISRPSSVQNKNKTETGGLSGNPLFEISTRLLSDMYRLTRGNIPLIGVGGVSSGYQAYAKIRAGASLVQLYSAMVYYGPRIAVVIAEELADLIKKDHFSSIAEAIGADHR
jgi:dihydroorotate dehydrogenase